MAIYDLILVMSTLYLVKPSTPLPGDAVKLMAQHTHVIELEHGMADTVVTCRLQGAERVAIAFACTVPFHHDRSMQLLLLLSTNNSWSGLQGWSLKPGSRGPWYSCGGGQEANRAKPYCKHEIE